MKHQLKADHDALRELTRSFATLACGAKPADMGELMQRRKAISTLFRAHLTREDEALRQALAGVAPGSPLDLARQAHGARFRAMFLNYSDHIKHWTPDRIDTEWRRYGQGCVDLHKRLCDLMDWEEREMLPLLPVQSRAA